MRLWLKDSERLPDPTPVVTDDRKAILVGLVGWILGLATVLMLALFSPTPTTMAVVWTCAVGIILGGAGLLYTHRRRRTRQ
jgi:cobalamin synthase